MNVRILAVSMMSCASFFLAIGCGSDNEISLGAGGSTSSSGSNGSSSGGETSSSSTSSSSGAPLANFSFFVTSLKALQDLSGNAEGFGGDLRYGETGPGAGLRGADKLCATIAERSMPGASQKPWRAFLSAVTDENGQQVNAKDRIGEGPWYDRAGRLVSDTKANLLNPRPKGGDATIANDLPNEDGIPNHQPDPNQPALDNHDTLTGSNGQGMLFNTTSTCLDWTSAAGILATEGKPTIGHTWPRMNGTGVNWMMDHPAGGCAAGINIMSMGGPPPGDYSVGAGGGYGGFYCFSLVP